MATALGGYAQPFEDLIMRSYEVASWESLEPCFYRRLDRDSLKDFISIRGLHNLNLALKGNKGAILCTGHIRGLFIVIIALELLGYKLNAIRRPPKNVQGPLGRLLNRERTLITRGGCKFLWMQKGNLGVALQAANALRRNEIIIALIDGRFGTEAVDVRFLNRLCSLPSGHVVLAQACGAPLLNFFVRSLEGGLPRIAEIDEPYYAGDSVVAAVQHCVCALEHNILQSPADWIWFQER
jgi:KDO2-lipid IV(A) lauroyltransferase